MNRAEFEQLVTLQGKRIDQDVVYEVVPAKWPTLVLRTVEVFNTGGRKVRLEGHYNRTFDAVTFNFVCPEAGGAICRVDVRGTSHGNAGRTHKHDLHKESDPKNNLPVAVARPDLVGLAAADVWRDLCVRARIHFTSTFYDPRLLTLPIA